MYIQLALRGKTLFTDGPYAVNYYFEHWANSITCNPFNVYLYYIYWCYFNLRIVFLIMQHRIFNKKSGRWSVPPVKVDKSYEHIHILQERIVEAKLNDQQGMSHFVVLVCRWSKTSWEGHCSNWPKTNQQTHNTVWHAFCFTTIVVFLWNITDNRKCW